MSNLEPDFNPKAFLALAKKLLETQDDPAALRTVISRSYYAAFLFARRKLRMGRAGHKDVWDALAGLDGAKWWLAAAHARNLCRQRNDADYGDKIGGLIEEAKKALKMADQIIREIGDIGQA